MKSNRELLELAAKSVGMDGSYYKSKRMVREFVFVDDDGIIPDGRTALSLWNPLVDDGCALRLAVKLNLTVRCAQYDAFTQVFIGDHDSRSSISIIERSDCIEDMGRITRRAIVRAAAIIGEEMK